MFFRKFLLSLFFISSSFANQIVTVFAHGLGANKTTAAFYQSALSNHGFIDGNLEVFNFQDYKNMFTSCLAQDDDIHTLDNACKKYRHAILVGVSRGAATITNYLGVMQPHNIAAAVVDSPFDMVDTVKDNVSSRAGWIPGVNIAMQHIGNTIFSGYNPDGMQPITSAPHIPHTIPVLLVCSKKDDLIPHTSSVNLYKAMRNAGHPNVHLLILDHGQHGFTLWGQDGYLYRNVVHAFYKKHNLPHRAAWAQDGQQYFALCQPSLESLQ